jgi:cytochrome aa3-600 menaquinol oxidase subunit 1
MPRNSSLPFLMSVAFFFSGFGFVFNWFWMASLGIAGILLCMIIRSQQRNTEYSIPVEEIKQTETALGRV